ncbi:MAG TPA: DPP IV N-terminal domain-containing protein [Candidatus Krumholzibacteria bacterium]|nr:DPP IV N-terminal domain-containing protein [Candidatus Krumholzibacteria bacterium]
MILRLFLFLLAVSTTTSTAADRLTLESIFLEGAHDGPDRPSVQWIDDGRALVRSDSEDGSLVSTRIEASNGEERAWLRVDPWVDPVHGEVEAASAEVAPGERHVLLRTRTEARWRRSTFADHWVLDRETGERFRLSSEGQELHAAFSPDGARVGFVVGSQLRLLDLGSREVATIGPVHDAQVTHGDPDWVYEEEFDFSEAWWWSPDSEHVALLRFDRAGVSRFPMVVTGDGPMPRHEPFDYPKAGSRNSRVSLLLHPWADTDAQRVIATVDTDQGYLVRADFTPDGRTLTYQILDRDQRGLRLFALDLTDTDAMPRLVLEETAEAWVEVDRDLHLLDDGSFLWTSRRSGFRHVWRGRLDGGALEPLTQGDFDVHSIAGANTDHAILLTQRTRPVDRNLERLDLDDARLTRLSGERGWSSAKVAPDAEAVVHTWSTADQRPQVELIDPRGRRLASLHEDTMEDLADLDPVEFEMQTIEVEGAPEMWGRITRRGDFDPAQEHPVLIYVYGGPGAQAARDRWGGSRSLFHRMLVERGWVVVTADGRGSAGRGVEYETATYLQLGTHEIDDQVRLVDWLRAQEWVDPDALAIHGSSYGGYASIGAAIRAEGRLAAAIAAAPVTDWRFYDTGYTERYMLTPGLNPEGYEQGSWLHQVDDLEVALLLLHGTGDDNVHDQNTHRLVSALVEAHKTFDLMIYPDKNHALPGEATRYDVYRRHAEHLDRHVAPVGDVEGSPE